jgi:hypothetical protein
MRKLITAMIVMGVLLLGEISLQATIVDSLSSPVASGVFSNGGDWGSEGDGFRIKWTVSQNQDQSWHYKYEFLKANGDPLTKLTSHITISLSDNITACDLYNFGSDIDEVTFGTFGPAPSNPGFPTGESIYGVKFDLADNQAIAEFDSTRQPMWGDFYAKSGASQDGVSPKSWNYAYNVDIGEDVANLHSYMGTPVDDFDNELFKILVPNTIPEPAMICIVALGGVSLIRRKNKT